MEYETFYDIVKDFNGTMKVTIPQRLCQFADFKVGDHVKVMIQKKEPTAKEPGKPEDGT